LLDFRDKETLQAHVIEPFYPNLIESIDSIKTGMALGVDMTVIFRISHGSQPAFSKRSILGTPNVIVDEMPPTKSMADGRFYTSKRKFREVTRAHGLVEVGNDPAMLRRRSSPKPDRGAVKAAVHRAFSRAGLGA